LGKKFSTFATTQKKFSMNTNINQLFPQPLWSYFNSVCSVPRPSKKEEKIIAFLKNFADENKLLHKEDLAGNILICKPASPGFENRKTLVLQSHLDMVCEKNSDTLHDFDTDPIVPYIDGEWVRAKGTTLGADCGIGIAAQMAILASKTLEHGPIECLFTVDEETGLTGANALQPNFFRGSILLNLDSEDEGELYIGCAGGVDTLATFEIVKQPALSHYFPFEVSVTGLLGGHSGDDIDKGRGNAIKLLVRFIRNIMSKYDLKLAHIEGGNLRNAIPREAKAVMLVPAMHKESVVVDFNLFRNDIIEELGDTEPLISLSLGSTSLPEKIFSDEFTQKLVLGLHIVPNGVISMSHRMHGMVETSTNLASIKAIDRKQLVVTTSQRSDRESGKWHIASIVYDTFALIGATVVHSDGYPGWTPKPDAEIVATSVRAYKECFNEEPKVRSIHAGLECGLFLEK
jgi:dipeptidase D